METLLVRRHEDAGFKQLDDDTLAFRAASYASHMKANGIRPDQYNQVYELAVAIYNETENFGPFGVDYMIKAAQRLNESKREYVVYKKPSLKALPSCSTCQGSKLSYKMDGARIIGINRNEDGSIRKCEVCSV